MRIVHTAADLAPLAPRADDDERGRRAVVMTMGALHEGHLALVRAAREAAEHVVVTVFVNPLQFNDASDLERYPRDLDADAALLEPLGVDVLYAPSVEDVYPGGRPVVTVSAGEINDVLEGSHRPGHFDGVLTVVLKLMHLTRPDVAYFGQKDAQQVIAIRTMCRDLNVPVEIEVVPTVRDADGLALSSRNARLSESERADALVLSRALGEAEQVIQEGGPLSLALTVARAALAEVPDVVPDYVAAMDPASARVVEGDYRGEVVIAVAAHVGETRLIDNVMTRVGPREGAAEA
ncbi:pantoate--beta-alanine ligase [Demequina sp. TTPB684]|uniref:pantoate--beta-alanine ligase n=1 Tax=unclassified Demequina TaxID=2620311 RepID=UPI001CF14BA6|nr:MULTISPECIES: pantoate--beta-alanine ligase [unclassified Demequina]MCB2413347.1 pantoate--beta-alanine ligase [Demequina sp. TTPB684]UPU87485.1 pantoate--beta-alanine ligase [Demequina sp. TMPB413]